jgi:hypothetical protein
MRVFGYSIPLVLVLLAVFVLGARTPALSPVFRWLTGCNTVQQSTVTAGTIILAFVVYTTLKGNLRRYLQVVGIV